MKKRRKIFPTIAILLAGCMAPACREEVFAPESGGDLVRQGRYLAAKNINTVSLNGDTYEERWFEEGTPYRLLAYTKPYIKTASTTTTEGGTPEAQTSEGGSTGGETAITRATHCRFNKVAWEGKITETGLHSINIDSDPDKWFGFKALDGETPGDDGLVSLDFYGFTYGKTVAADSRTNYIQLDDVTEGSTPTDDLENLKHTETVSNDLMHYDLNDLMRAELLDRNIINAGANAETDAQSILPFKHCFSRLRFLVVQQIDEDKSTNEDTVGYFDNLEVTDITVTNTYGTGAVYLMDGKVELSGDTVHRKLKFRKEGPVSVTTKMIDVGEMIVFPSDGSALKGTVNPDGYDVGLSITLRSTNKSDLQAFKTNTGSTENIIEKDGKYTLTIKKNSILDNNNIDPKSDEEVTLRLRQNTAYTIALSFQKNTVRIITLIPQVEPWLPGEPGDGWQDQALGQPQMFDNVIWSDRNLGADHFNPETNFEGTIGYYYQPHRNIPYFPFNTEDYFNNDGSAKTDNDGNTITPTPDQKRDEKLASALSYDDSRHKVYPMVDEKILNMMHQTTGYKAWQYGVKGNGVWAVLEGDIKETVPKKDENGNVIINEKGEIEYEDIYIYPTVRPQMFIPEKKPSNTYFDFYESIWDDDNMHWEGGNQNQPVAGSWTVPSIKDFMTIFPSTPHAGNFAFRGGGLNKDPMNGWSQDCAMDDNVKTLRVTVPYYVIGMEGPGMMDNTQYRNDISNNYRKAWETLQKYKDPNNPEIVDPGTTHIGNYTYYDKVTKKDGHEPGWGNLSYEPDGDPEDGYASVYVISRAEGVHDEKGDSIQNRYYLTKATRDYDSNPNDVKYKIKSWGTIYAIKRVYTPQAYRMRWRVVPAEGFGTTTNPVPAFYVEVSRYRCSATDILTEENYMTYDWNHPAATIYFPMCGIVEKGVYYNFGTECLYASSDAITIRYNDWLKRYQAVVSALQMKVTGDDDSNIYISIVRNVVDRNYGMQVRPTGVGGVVNNN